VARKVGERGVGGLDAIVALRCLKLGGRFEDFWERRSVVRELTG
jgi:hypothetical protein